MKRLSFFVFLFLIGCEDTREPDCGECGLEIYSSLEKSNGNYILEYNEVEESESTDYTTIVLDYTSTPSYEINYSYI